MTISILFSFWEYKFLITGYNNFCTLFLCTSIFVFLCLPGYSQINVDTSGNQMDLLVHPDLGTSPILSLRNTGANFKQNWGPGIEFSTSIGLAKIMGIDQRSSSNSTWRGGLSFKTRVHTLGSDFGFYERMRITADGNIGIGTSQPFSLLELRKVEDLGTAPMLILRNEGAEFKGSTGPAIEFASSIGLAKIIGVDERGGANSTWRGGLAFKTRLHTNGSDAGFEERMRISGAGNVGIGTAAPTQKLSVNGKINAEEIILEQVSGADFVFEENYDLRSLEETEQFIKDNKRLPEIPSAAEMAAEGLALKEMNVLLLQKVEELTLHLIRQEKTISNQEERFIQQSKEIKDMQQIIKELKAAQIKN